MMNARDSKRKNDLKIISKALELYYDENGSYPALGYACNYFGSVPRPLFSVDDNWDLLEILLLPHIAKLPIDPLSETAQDYYFGHYFYNHRNNGQGYVLFTFLEKSKNDGMGCTAAFTCDTNPDTCYCIGNNW